MDPVIVPMMSVKFFGLMLAGMVLAIATVKFARITFSPLIVAASGKVKDTVFSKWKGRNYIRARVTPSNPNTAAQQLVRNSLAACVTLWQSFTSEIETAWNVYASPYSISGYNAWMSQNRAAEQATTDLTTTPVNADIVAITDMAAATGSGSKEVDITWTDTGAGAGYYVYVLARKDATDIWVVIESATTLVSAETLTIAFPEASTDYEVTVAVELVADSTFSESDYDTVTSNA